MPGTIMEAFAEMSSAEGITNGVSAEHLPPTPTGKSGKKLSVERIYQKKTQLEHILLRPDTYIGSVEPVTDTMWVYDNEQEMMVQKEISYVPGLYKIYDEILVNAADNKQRDPKMDCIKIEIDPEKNVISVWNNGKGIPVVMHKDEKMMVPSMIFGHLLTSSNYNDKEEKVTGGRNGYGAKLCNIFSTTFTVETACREYKKTFKQIWANNMSKTSEPRIKEFTGEDFTKITFTPDLSKFQMESLDKDIVQLLSRRAYDVAASSRGVKVFLNGKRLAVKNFKDYVELYIKKKEDDMGNPLKISYELVNERWEVAMTISDKNFQQVSFVNSIATTKGGRHVDHVADMIIKQLIEIIKKKSKGFQIRPFQVKNHMWVFVNCLIVNPTFDSQTKETMTLQAKNFGSKCTLSDKFINSVTKCGIIESILSWAKFKQDSQLKAQSGKKKTKLKGVPKLEDANDAGGRNSLDCTLILTEGDSAKTLAVSGLGVVGRDKYGVFPLRGKLLNVREATHKQILENAEIRNIVKILGLEYKKKYESVDDLKTLRYGKLMIMTDQDQDGSHIKGLLINFIHHNWPTLLKLPFLEEFITPIVKATKSKEEHSFYSLPEFEEWKSEKENWHTYKIKYYKGLGTSTSKEAKEYFADMKRHRILFEYGGPNDDSCINMAFSKKCAEQRKEWLTGWMVDSKRRRELGLAEQYLYEKDTKSVNYTDFVNKELVLFSNCDNERSIPSMVDGLKPGQRKVLFTCLKRNDKREVKVAQLAGSVAEHSAYHHGEQSLMSTIINLAQNFVGSNNINVLQPIGQFGTRLNGGKDAASARYIFTMLSPLAKFIFHPHDEPLFTHQYDDSQKIEPLWYIPIIPMVLVNGADGIGTGWMTRIPNYNPREIVKNLMRLLDGEDILPMVPWYKNFRGAIQSLGSRYIVFGEVAIINDEKVEITELPVGTWTQAYKENVLEILLHGANEKSTGAILDYKEYNTDTTVRFEVSMTHEKLIKAEEEGLHKFFKLQSAISTSSMCAFDENNCMQKYDSVTKILLDFYKLRLLYYQKRKDYLEGMLQAESQKLSNQARFIIEKCNNTLTVENKKRKVMVDELQKRGYDPDPVRVWKLKQNKEATLADEVEAELEQSDTSEIPDIAEVDAKNRYDYLLGMAMWTLTQEKKDELLKRRDEKLHEFKVLQAKSSSMLWREDLEAFLEKLDSVEEKERADEVLGPKIKLAGKKNERGGKGKTSISVTKPSARGRRVEPKFDEELLKKYERADITKQKIKVPRKPKETDGTEKEKKPKKEPKQPKSKDSPKDSPKKKGKGKKRRGSDSEDDSDMSFDELPSPEVSQPRTVARRSAAAKVKFSYDSESEPELGEIELHDNEGLENGADNPVTDQALDDQIAISDTDSEFEAPTKPKKKKAETDEQQTKGSSDAMFESLIGGSSSSRSGTAKEEEDDVIDVSDEDSPKKKAPPKKRQLGPKVETAKPKKQPAKKQKKKAISDSEDDFEVQPKKRTKKMADSDDDFVADEEVASKVSSRTGGRARKPTKFVFDDEDEDESN